MRSRVSIWTVMAVGGASCPLMRAWDFGTSHPGPGEGPELAPHGGWCWDSGEETPRGLTLTLALALAGRTVQYSETRTRTPGFRLSLCPQRHLSVEDVTHLTHVLPRKPTHLGECSDVHLHGTHHG